jgi:hypothetical protein
MLVLPKLSNDYGLRSVVHKLNKIMFAFCFVSSLDKFSELSFTEPHGVFKKILLYAIHLKKHLFTSLPI